MNQTTQTHISYKKKIQICNPKNKNQICKKPNLHDTGGDLQNFCMTRPSGRDLYKTYPDLQGLGKKKKKDQQTQIAISVLDLQQSDAISGVEGRVAGRCSPCQAWERDRSGWFVNVISMHERL